MSIFIGIGVWAQANDQPIFGLAVAFIPGAWLLRSLYR
jgi:hypothetical protein